jgi:hypothetical protein
MSAYVTAAIAFVSASAAVATLLITLHANRRSDRDSAREEALALAELRGQLLIDLHADYELRTRRLEAAVAELSEQLDAALPSSDRPAGGRARLGRPA